MKQKSLIAVLTLTTLFTQCNFQKIGRDTGKGFGESSNVLASNLMAGVHKGLSDPAFQKNLTGLIDSLVSTAGQSANRSTRHLLDSLLSERLVIYINRLVEEATGQKVRSNLSAITTDLQGTVRNLLGVETKERLQLLIASAMQEILTRNLLPAVASLQESMTGAPLRTNLSALRDSLLNNKTNAAIKALVDTAMVALAYRLKNDVNPSLQDNLSFIQRNATTLLVVLGIIALTIVIVVWRIKQKYAKMTNVLTSQIYAISDQHAYDDLTSRIKEKATIAGVEPSLRQVLSQNGLLGKESRESWQAKKAAILRNKS